MHKMRLLTKIKQNRKNKKFLKEKKKGKKILKWDSIRIVKQQQMGRCDIICYSAELKTVGFVMSPQIGKSVKIMQLQRGYEYHKAGKRKSTGQG